MRTTLTLDPDVAAKVRDMARERGISFKEAVNTVLRAGLSGEKGVARPYRLPSRKMGIRAGIDLDKALHLAAEMEDDESVRKLELRK